MTAANAIKSQGTAIHIGDGASPQVFYAIASVHTIGGPQGSAQILDATTLSSTAKEKIMGLPDLGKVQVGMNYDPTDMTGQVAMITARDSQQLTDFQILLPNLTQTMWSFSAFVMDFSLSDGVDEIVKATSNLEISGGVVITELLTDEFGELLRDEFGETLRSNP